MEWLIPRIPTSIGIRRRLFALGMQFSLVRIRWPEKDNPLGNWRRSNAVKRLSSPDQVLRMRFSREDLGYRYHPGLVSNAVGTEPREPNSSVWKPIVGEGIRLPCFGLKAAGEGGRGTVSWLDLPGMAAAIHGEPVCLLLLRPNTHMARIWKHDGTSIQDWV